MKYYFFKILKRKGHQKLTHIMIKQKQKNSSFRNMDIYLSQRVCDSWNAKELSSLNCLYNINGIREQHMKNKNNTKKGGK